MQNKNTYSVHLKWLIPVLLACGAVGGTIHYVSSKRNQDYQEKLNARRVKTEVRDIRKVLMLTGKVLPLSYIEVYSPVTGQVKEIAVAEGDKVQNNDVLFTVQQDSNGQKELETMQSELEKARLELSAAQDSYSRRKTVKDLFSESDNEKARLEVERKRLEFEAARQRLSLHEEKLGLRGLHKTIVAGEGRPSTPPEGRLSLIFVRAPRDGVVTFINKAVGERVVGTTESAMTLSDLNKMIVRSRILEADLALVRTGMPVEVKLDAFRDKLYRGTVSRISQQGVEDTTAGYTYFVTDVQLENPDEDVRAQMNAQLSLIVAEKHQVLTLPTVAVATLNGNSVVELLPGKSKQPVYKAIRTGLTTELHVEILDNTLGEGEEVLTIDFAKLDLKALGEGKLGGELSDIPIQDKHSKRAE